MSETPNTCGDCPANAVWHCKLNAINSANRLAPGPACPFVRLDVLAQKCNAVQASNDALMEQKDELRTEITRMAENHVRDLAKADELTKQARQTSQMWKDQHLAGNAEIERLREAADRVATRLEAANEFPATCYLDDVIIGANAEILRAALNEGGES